MPAPVLQFKRGNAGVAGTVPALRPGEPAISLNNFDFFIGIDTSVANNKFFGSHRYWGREDGTNSLKLKLVDKNGSNYVAVKSPDTLSGIITYTLPGIQGGSNTVLTNDGSGNLSWGSGSSNAVFSGITTIGGNFLDVNVDADFSGITTFSNTTDNTLGNPDTGAVQIDGGLGVNKNVTVGAGLSVVGQSYFIGTATFYGGNINLGDSDGDNISVAGEFVSNLVPNATNTYDLGLNGKRWKNGFYSGNLDVTGNLTVNGLVTVGGGTTVILYGQDVYIKNKDIILGYTTSITNGDASTDDTANHAGVAIASTVGSPLSSFSASGINTLPDTYKQLMWFKEGTLGFGTDAFAFNYGVAIGTTTMVNGVRLAVGSGITMSDTSIKATNFYGALTGSITGNAASADQVKTVTASNTNATYYVTFVDANNGSATNETVYTDDSIYYNPGTNTFTTQYGYFTGNVTVVGTIIGTATTATRATLVDTTTAPNGTFYPGLFVSSTGTASTAVYVDAGISYVSNTDTLTLSGDIAINGGDVTTSASTFNLVNGTATNINFAGAATDLVISAATGITTVRNTLKVGTGVGITQFSGSVSTGTSTSSVPTSSAIIDYISSQVGAIDLTFGINADTGGPSTVSTSQTLNIYGTANEVETSVSGQTVTVGLPNAVIVGTSLSAPTVRTNIIQSQNTGATVLTLTGNDATFADDLTVQGNLYVQGSTTQIDTTTLAIEDRTIELGRITSATQPTTTTWDLAVLFNYGDGTAKKAGVVWEASGATKRFQFTTDVNPGTDGSDSQTNLPSFTVSNFAPIEVGQLWVTDCAGTSQVISCTGTERFLENITVDAGTF
jgi:hypothetical protein